MGLSVCDERSFYGFQLRVQKLKYRFCLPLKKWCLFCNSVYFSCYIVWRSSNFSVTGINNVHLLVVNWIFWLTFFVRGFEVCYSFVEFVYVYCLIHQSVVVFCLVFLRKSAAQFFIKIHVSFLFRDRSAVQFFFCIFQF